MTISLYEILLVYNWLIKVTAPLGAIPNNPLSVVWFLLELNSSVFNRRLLGILHFILVQSIITRVEGYLSLNTSGIVFVITSRDGQMFI